MTISGAI